MIAKLITAVLVFFVATLAHAADVVVTQADGATVYVYAPAKGIVCHVSYASKRIAVEAVENNGRGELFAHVAQKSPGRIHFDLTTVHQEGDDGVYSTKKSYYYVFPQRCMEGVKMLPAHVQEAIYVWGGS